MKIGKFGNKPAGQLIRVREIDFVIMKKLIIFFINIGRDIVYCIDCTINIGSDVPDYSYGVHVYGLQCISNKSEFIVFGFRPTLNRLR